MSAGTGQGAEGGAGMFWGSNGSATREKLLEESAGKSLKQLQIEAEFVNGMLRRKVDMAHPSFKPIIAESLRMQRAIVPIPPVPRRKRKGFINLTPTTAINAGYMVLAKADEFSTREFVGLVTAAHADRTYDIFFPGYGDVCKHISRRFIICIISAESDPFITTHKVLREHKEQFQHFVENYKRKRDVVSLAEQERLFAEAEEKHRYCSRKKDPKNHEAYVESQKPFLSRGGGKTRKISSKSSALKWIGVYYSNRPKWYL